MPGADLNRTSLRVRKATLERLKAELARLDKAVANGTLKKIGGIADGPLSADQWINYALDMTADHRARCRKTKARAKAKRQAARKA